MVGTGLFHGSWDQGSRYETLCDKGNQGTIVEFYCFTRRFWPNRGVVRIGKFLIANVLDNPLTHDR